MCSGEPQGKDGNQKIREKCKQYLDRAEELQEYLKNKEVLHANTHTRLEEPPGSISAPPGGFKAASAPRRHLPSAS